LEKPKNLGKLFTDIVIARNERGECGGLAKNLKKEIKKRGLKPLSL